MRASRLAALAFSAVACVVAGSPARAAEYVGSLHEHSAYSDGYPGTTPATYYASGRRHGLSFMGGSDHSANTAIPLTAGDECLGPAAPTCAETDRDALRKWEATAEQADAATTQAF